MKSAIQRFTPMPGVSHFQLASARRRCQNLGRDVVLEGGVCEAIVIHSETLRVSADLSIMHLMTSIN